MPAEFLLRARSPHWRQEIDAMFAKIFSQIFDSSIANNHKHRHVFMDLLVLADSDGVIDMTEEAVSRRTNVPLEDVKAAIEYLSSPDTRSNSPNDEGRRLLPVDERKPWGWQIVNYHHYRAIRDEATRREYFREYRRAEREKKREKKAPKNGKSSNKVTLAKRGEYHHDMRYPSEPVEHKPECPCVECRALREKQEAF